MVGPAESRGFAHQHRPGRRGRRGRRGVGRCALALANAPNRPTWQFTQQRKSGLCRLERCLLPLAPKACVRHGWTGSWEGRHGRETRSSDRRGALRVSTPEPAGSSSGFRREPMRDDAAEQCVRNAGTEIMTDPAPRGTARPERPRVIGLAAMEVRRRGGARTPLVSRELSPRRVSIQTHAYGVRSPRALSSLLSLDAPNAHWPAASLVLAPILNLRGRSR